MRSAMSSLRSSEFPQTKRQCLGDYLNDNENAHQHQGRAFSPLSSNPDYAMHWRDELCVLLLR